MTTTKKTTEEKSPTRYVAAVGRRKTASARVRLMETSEAPTVTVNGRLFPEYFPTELLQSIVVAPLKVSGLSDRFSVSIVVSGGGIHSQAEASRLGVARALVGTDDLLRPVLRAAGYLTRDARAVERKKPGLKKARRAPQWSKR